MEKGCGLIVDYKNEGASLQIFPRKPLLSINQSNWCNIKFEHHNLPGFSVGEHSSRQNTLVILHEPARLVQRRLGGLLKDESAKSGDIVFCPHGVPHSAEWGEKVSFSLIFLEPSFFESDNNLELMPGFAQSDPAIYGIGQHLRLQSQMGMYTSQLYLDSIASFLSTHLSDHYSIGRKTMDRSALTQKDLQQLYDYIDANLSRKLALQELAAVLNMSHGNLSKLFKKTTNKTVYQYVIELRLDRAARLLQKTNFRIEEIALLTGFVCQSHLTKYFRDRFAITPHQYRKAFR